MQLQFVNSAPAPATTTQHSTLQRINAINLTRKRERAAEEERSRERGEGGGAGRTTSQRINAINLKTSAPAAICVSLP
jgi:hypothetical protein